MSQELLQDKLMCRIADRLKDSDKASHYERRLLDCVERNPASGCWEWKKGRNANGYGLIRILGRGYSSSLAHRVSYTLFCSRIPDGLFVCHRCDNPSCVNPTHLVLGDADFNMSDMVRKGRWGGRCGERSPCAKLTSSQVVDIRKRYSAGEKTGRIAKDYGVTPMTVIYAATGKKWRHLPGASKRRGRRAIRMTEEQWAEARGLRMSGMTYREIAERYGVVEISLYSKLRKMVS